LINVQRYEEIIMNIEANEILQSMIDHEVPSIEDTLIAEEEKAEVAYEAPIRISEAEGAIGSVQSYPQGLEWTLFEIGVIERLNRIEFIQSQAAIDAAKGRSSRISKYANPEKRFPEIFRFMSNLRGKEALEYLISEGRKGISSETSAGGASELAYGCNCILDSITRAIARAISFAQSNKDQFFRYENGLTENKGLSGKELSEAQNELKNELQQNTMISVADEEMYELHARAALKDLVQTIKSHPVIQAALNIHQPTRITRRNGKPFREQTQLFISEANRWDQDTTQFVPVSLEDLIEPYTKQIEPDSTAVGFDKNTMLF